MSNKSKVKTHAGGRPKIEFDIPTVVKLGRARATYEGMAAWFDCHVDTISDRMKNEDKFSGAYKKGFESVLIALSNKQIEEALNGNTALLIFLGKNYLGQADKQEVKTEHTIASFTDIVTKAALKTKVVNRVN